MDRKETLYVAGAFIGGLAIGATVGYLMTRKSCEETHQEELDEVVEYYKKKYANKEDNNEPEKTDKRREEREDEVVKNDKPSIAEMSSIIAGYNSDSANRTSYSNPNNQTKTEELKEVFKKLKEKEAKENKAKVIALDYSKYMELEDSGSEMEFNYNVDTEKWLDWNDVEYDAEDLPFDPEDVVWIDEQCFLYDEENNCTYILGKVDENG